ncbi:flavin monoamine oxidase family protein [Gottfriedia acidiceleris]|uniref:Flavin monoamine oxidase family protein n=1 Tax=Gottfriedia acidiceleris TaxID=371036 RepID=A0ABY4JVR9_9BACI|nr:flavin monoamine oxidase family protein [Gottfriedia acidiceleris]UPM56420.1 flavin monoamine oxidase family protein [Gottfriedia acidiceleris]
MINIIQNGLTKTGSSKSVIIIGGGISGLVSASLLKEAGHQVTIIEANRRIGGRIYTKREPFLDYQYVDLGAMRIPSIHHLTFALINKLNLQVNEFINSTPNDLIYANNVLTNQKTYESNPDILKYSVAPNEKGKTAVELLLSAVGPVIDFINQDPIKNWKIIIDKYDQYSMENFLKYNPIGTSLSTGAIDMIKTIVGLEGFPELGFTAILREVIVLLTPNLKLYEITGGTDYLVRAFLPQLRDNIILNERVTRIIQGNSKVTIHTENEILTRQKQYECDYVISTIPFSLFNFVDIFPYESISDIKWKVIRELHYADSTKIAIQFRTKFWEKLGLVGGKLTTDLPIKFSYFPSHDFGFETGIMLASYTWEDDATIWDSMKNNKRIDKALANLSIIFGDVVYKEFLVGYSQSWTQFSFSGGAFVMYKPNQQRELGPFISTPEGRIHFGGSHASSTPGWVQGAIESGIRTANEVNNL